LVRLFVRARKMGIVATEQALAEFPRNDYCPDICFWGLTKSAGIQGGTLIFPVPDFICEVLSASTEARDRGLKFEDYAAHGVLEYWIVDAETRVIEQYVAREGKTS
jgi:Uma2 family endonuclease